MQVAVVTLFPEMFAELTEHGVSGRGIETGLLELSFWNPREYCTDKHRNVDDKPFGGGPGMLMKTEPLLATIGAAWAGLGGRESGKSRCIYLSPQGQRINHQKVTELAALESITLVCGRYQGIDARVIEAEVDEELSLGDFVLSGGEIAAMALLDALIRIQPGALGDEDSATQDSLMDGLLHAPEYTRPQQVEGRVVPPVLLSGDHAAIAHWRNKQRLGVTWLKRPDLLDRLELSQEQQALLDEFKQSTGQTERDPVLHLGQELSKMSKNKIIEKIETEQMGKELPEFGPGDTVVVQVKIKEGDRERLQAFEGVVIGKRNRGLNSSFTVRKISHGVGVERTFQTFSPLVDSVTLKRRGDVRQAKLYYLRELTGRAARISEKLDKKTGDQA